ncbi:DUF4192 family protein [Nocardia amamiensis]|uniref:DUF4192 family protein n=1 Tax=Nocardia amamiensis TaxID=404578 RepID=UPI00082D457A|nr:DUF4192 family protein [Nocardia amamiensis]
MIDYIKMTGGEFVSSVAALLMTSTYSLPEIENCIIIGILHSDGVMHNFGVIPIEKFDAHDENTIAILGGKHHGPDDLVMRLVAVADADHAARAVFALDALADAIEREGIRVLNVIMTPKIATGQEWTDLRTKEYGTLPDPAMTAPALAAIVDGHGPLPDPDDIARTFAQTTPADTDPARAEHRDNPRRFAKDTLTEARKLISEYARTYAPDFADHWTDGGIIGADYPADERARLLTNTADGLAARVGVLAEVSGSARDALLGLALLDIPAAARIYSHIANQLDGIRRSHMLALAGVLYHVDGRPYYAREALYLSGAAALIEEGHLSETMPVIARALLAAARADVEADTARRFLALGPAAAKRFGIDTPEFDLYPAE